MEKLEHSLGQSATLLAMVMLCLCALSVTSRAAVGRMAKVQGRVLAADTGEPIGLANVVLIPEDSTARRFGAPSNLDGTFLLEAPAGNYTLQVSAVSYARKRITEVKLEVGQLLPLNIALAPQRLQVAEVLVEARAAQNADGAMLLSRKRANTVGDAVSSEQMRRSPDKNAGEVLRRVTGLSVSDGKYVFVRGLGERYSSTEVDGVRIASPEQNKRVVPMDLFPAALLDNIVVQKTYTADRSGEFGGGDVQVHTRDFPGQQAWAFSFGQGSEAGSTFHDRLSYGSNGADFWGFGSGSRQLPEAIELVAGSKPLTEGNGNGFSTNTLKSLARQFNNLWSPTRVSTPMNGSYSLTYGNEFKFLERPLGFVQAWSFAHSYDQKLDERIALPYGVPGAAVQDQNLYNNDRYTSSAQLGGVSSLSYRLSPRAQVHLRGFYTNSADDEVRNYSGLDYSSGETRYVSNTRLMYVQRNVLSGSVDGQHEFPGMLHSKLEWRFSRSSARRQQPDRRESNYLRIPTDESDPNSGDWGLTVGRREYGDLRDHNHGGNLKATVPYALGSLGKGKVVLGYDSESKTRDNFYRRFNFYPSQFGLDVPPESAYDRVDEATLPQDNYQATQDVQALFVSVDLPLGSRVRGNLGARRETGEQHVISHDLFNPALVTSEGKLSNADWLAAANLNWSMTTAVQLRVAASRTLSRPDLDELSPRPTLEYLGDYQRLGNPNLNRASVENYDLRLEAYPTSGEVLAAGVFLKKLHDPIENTVRGASSGFVLIPENSDGGLNRGVELELRTSLSHLAGALHRFSLNTNLSYISSKVRLKAGPSQIGSQEHPLQGQAKHVFNAALSYLAPGSGFEASVLLSDLGERLVNLRNAGQGIPDQYDPGNTTMDASMSFGLIHGGRLKVAASNLLDHEVRELIGESFVTRSYRNGRALSLSFSYGSGARR